MNCLCKELNLRVSIKYIIKYMYHIHYITAHTEIQTKCTIVNVNKHYYF